MTAEFNGPIFEENIRRETERKGEEEICDQCKNRSTIGVDLHAAHTIIHDGTGFPWWICQSCIEAHYPRNN